MNECAGSSRSHSEAIVACDRILRSFRADESLSDGHLMTTTEWGEYFSSHHQSVDYHELLGSERTRFAFTEHLHSNSPSAMKLVRLLQRICDNIKSSPPSQRFIKIRLSIEGIPKEWLSSVECADSTDDREPQRRCRLLELWILEDVMAPYEGLNKMVQFCSEPDDTLALADVVTARVNLIRSSPVLLEFYRDKCLHAINPELMGICPHFLVMVHLATGNHDNTSAPDPWLIREQLGELMSHAHQAAKIDFLFNSSSFDDRLIGVILMILLESNAGALLVALAFVEAAFGMNETFEPLHRGLNMLLTIVIPSV